MGMYELGYDIHRFLQEMLYRYLVRNIREYDFVITRIQVNCWINIMDFNELPTSYSLF